MKRKTKQTITTIFVMGAMFFFYSIYTSLFAGGVILTEEQYTHAAQEIVNNSLPSSQCAANSTIGCYQKTNVVEHKGEDQ
ncbi:MAG: hypothetical protein H6Q65_838 [Firmicutes bacterium]|nr:hypothetical protein [Bacillota bacterium]